MAKTLTIRQKEQTRRFMSFFCLEVINKGTRAAGEEYQVRHRFADQPYTVIVYEQDDYFNWTVSNGPRGVFFRTLFTQHMLEDYDETYQQLYQFFGLQNWSSEQCTPPIRHVEKWRSTVHAANLSKQDMINMRYQLEQANNQGENFYEIYINPASPTSERHVVFSRKSSRRHFDLPVTIDGIEVNLNAFAFSPYAKLERLHYTEVGSIFENAPV